MNGGPRQSAIPPWVWGVGKAILYGVTSALVLLALAIALSGPSQRERKQTARNVAKLVAESQKNRQLLCVALVRDPSSSFKDDPDVRKLCGQVGIEPQPREETPVPEPSEAPEPPQPPPAPSVPGTPSESLSVAPTPTSSTPESPVALPSPSLPCIPILTCEGGQP